MTAFIDLMAICLLLNVISHCAGVVAQDCPVHFGHCPPTFVRPLGSVGPCRPRRDYGILLDLSRPSVRCSHTGGTVAVPAIQYRLTDVLTRGDQVVPFEDLASDILKSGACQHTIITFSVAAPKDVSYATVQKIVNQLFEIGLMGPTQESSNVRFDSGNKKP